MKKWILVFLAVALIVLAGSNINSIEQVTLEQLREEFDVVIILGQGSEYGKIAEEGGPAKIDVGSRINYTLDLFERQQEKPTIILSGYGRKGAEIINGIEVEVMYPYIAPAIQNMGYNPEEFILKENRSHQTIENAIFVKPLIPKDSERILVLSSAIAYQRQAMIIHEILDDYPVTIASMQPQTKGDRRDEGFLTFATSFLLLLPGDFLKLQAAKLGLAILG
jgi:uncharacterized SAM-binding protein YcdF (DUF218 family)